MINADIFNFQTEGITRGSNLVFSNLINVNDLDFDFQIYLEVYGLQTPKERLSHEVSVRVKSGCQCWPHKGGTLMK